MRLQHALLASAAVLSLTTIAQAATFKAWYLGVEGGANWISDVDADYALAAGRFSATDTSEISFDTGWAAFATAGYAFANGWRVEGEAGYRSNEMSGLFQGFDSARVFDGDLDEFSLMANVIYDIPVGERMRISLGAGAGGDFIDIDGQTTAGALVDPISGEDWRFAAQGVVGFGYALSQRWELSLNYRYLHVSPQSIGVIVPVLVDIGGRSQMVSLEDLSKHSLTVGLRYDLTPSAEPTVAPPPLPLPPPPPPAVKQFVVFFGFDKCEITAEADRVLADAAATAKSTGAAAIAIVGHTDTSGSTAYNQRLSNCRSNAAKTNLVAKGLPEGAITASGRGEAELMVETGDGVKEPQNRRATVDLK